MRSSSHPDTPNSKTNSILRMSLLKCQHYLNLARLVSTTRTLPWLSGRVPVCLLLRRLNSLESLTTLLSSSNRWERLKMGRLGLPGTERHIAQLFRICLQFHHRKPLHREGPMNSIRHRPCWWSYRKISREMSSRGPSGIRTMRVASERLSSLNKARITTLTQKITHRS